MIENYIQALFIMCGLWSIAVLLKMLICEIKKKGDGEKYLKYGKKLVP